MFKNIRTRQDVLRHTLAITAFAVAVPVLVVGALMSFIPGLSLSGFLFGTGIAFFIPLLIAPPISYLAMSMMRQLTLTIERVDDHVKFDPLTGVLNRNHFLNSIRKLDCNGALMIADADHFKAINDTRGHAAGDEALRILGLTLDEAIGEAGMVARLGGEEFGIFLPQADARSGKVMADLLCTTIRNLKVIVEGESLSMTISIGGTAHTARSLLGQSLKQADRRLYLAKSSGRDRAVFMDAPPEERAQDAA